MINGRAGGTIEMWQGDRHEAREPCQSWQNFRAGRVPGGRYRTSPRSAIAVNLIAWVIPLAVTALVIKVIYLPSGQAGMAGQIRPVFDQPAAKPVK
ncbi:MAG: hypothetical protein WCO00_02275 [Rhodospirillaceae bacterium]